MAGSFSVFMATIIGLGSAFLSGVDFREAANGLILFAAVSFGSFYLWVNEVKIWWKFRNWLNKDKRKKIVISSEGRDFIKLYLVWLGTSICCSLAYKLAVVWDKPEEVRTAILVLLGVSIYQLVKNIIKFIVSLKND